MAENEGSKSGREEGEGGESEDVDTEALLTPEQKRRLAALLEERTGKGVQCPMCSEQEWMVGDIRARIQGAGAILGGPGYPVVSAVCTNCGFHAFFNAIILGLEEPSQPSDGGRDDG